MRAPSLTGEAAAQEQRMESLSQLRSDQAGGWGECDWLRAGMELGSMIGEGAVCW